MVLAVFILSNYFDDADRKDELFLIPMFQDISEFYFNTGFKPSSKKKEINWKGGEGDLEKRRI